MKPLRDAVILLLAILVLVSVRIGPAPGAAGDPALVVSPALASPAVNPAPEAPTPERKDLEKQLEVARKCAAAARPTSRT